MDSSQGGDPSGRMTSSELWTMTAFSFAGIVLLLAVFLKLVSGTSGSGGRSPVTSAPMNDEDNKMA